MDCPESRIGEKTILPRRRRRDDRVRVDGRRSDLAIVESAAFGAAEPRKHRRQRGKERRNAYDRRDLATSRQARIASIAIAIRARTAAPFLARRVKGALINHIDNI
jgi:hypothetical protein